MADRRAEYEAAGEIAAPYDVAVAEGGSPIQEIVMQRAGRGDTTLVVGARLELPDDVDEFDLQEAINGAIAPDVTQGVYVSDQHLWFAPGAISPEQLAAVVTNGVQAVRADRLKRDEELAAVTARRENLVRGVEELVHRRQRPGDDPDPR